MDSLIDANAAAGRLGRLIGHPTVSHRDPAQVDARAFEAFRADLVELYPGVHRTLGLEVVAGGALLYRWKGTSEAGPVVLMSHYDVVPAPAEGWTHPPFSGALADGKVWGRGTIDTKGTLVSVLEAVETLVGRGFVPPRDVYLAFGHNEEVSGDGAPAIARLLADRGVKVSLVVDEGGAVVEGIFPGVTRPVAVVGVAEKGIADIGISVAGNGGHASTPPAQGPAFRLARALVRLETRPFPARLDQPTRQMLKTLGRSMPPGLGFVFRHLGLFGPLILFLFSRLSGETNAMVRTTVAVTQLEGSKGLNVLPARARAHLNIRIAPGETSAEVLARLKRTVADPKVEFTVVKAGEPSRISDSQGPAWDLVEKAIVGTFPGTVVVPYIMLAASDSRHWGPYSPFVYRFTPYALSKAERSTIHAVDEALPVESLGRGIAFYLRLLEGLGGLPSA